MKIKKFEFNIFGVNTYVVWNPESMETAVIDPGMADEREEHGLSDFISREGLQVTTLLNTHLHIDHTLGDDYVEERYGVGLQAHPADDFLGQRRDVQAQMFHMRIAPPKPLQISVELKAGDKIFLGKEYLEALEVPGHSPGSLAFYSPTGKFVITGDALFMGSVGRTDLPRGDHRTLIESVRTNLLSLPDDTIVYPGHGPETTIGAEKYQNPYLY